MYVPRSFTKAGNYNGPKFFGVVGIVIVSYLIGTKMNYARAERRMAELKEQQRLSLLKDIRQSGIVQRIIEKENLQEERTNKLNEDDKK
ncbi:hypothetical protein AKO1_008055 [Acrasis kona]|uniref:Uncharacterized protein n=1 Tax=Acrasis kona TaxID=1008807 RepID=A0AAW2YQQ0_9EUKA